MITQRISTEDAAGERLFVYGSLRRGEANHHWLAGASLLGAWQSTPAYTMYDLGEYPGITAHGQTAIQGEVYQLPPAALARIDMLEEYPVVYTRRQVTTPFGTAWIYVLVATPAGRPVIHSGDWCQRNSTDC
ncbi:MAG: gamma-glutamylcyclotransferase [Gammaproteobacteria bacterium]|nr:gamma-glutamylcyclotransferase [Gammaproteobacteria bacterium]